MGRSGTARQAAARAVGGVPLGGTVGGEPLGGTVVGFDLETTGIDPATVRVVSAALVAIALDGTACSSRTWLLDPAVEIPPAAAAVHGITTEHARAHGLPAAAAIAEILAALTELIAAGTPLVIFNAPYDLSVMVAEAGRHGLAALDLRRAVIVDPLVLDRGLDRYRRGPRTLAAMAEHYASEATDAHSADGDAAAAGRLARALTAAYPLLRLLPPAQLASVQREFFRSWARRHRRWLAGRGRLRSPVPTDWPLHGRPSPRDALAGRWWRWRSGRVVRRPVTDGRERPSVPPAGSGPGPAVV